MIALEGVTVSFDGGATRAVDGVTLSVRPGELVALLGESGSGKSTTLKLINRLIEPAAGRIVVDGEDVARLDPVQLRRRIGYAIQSVGLFPHCSVADNIAVVPRLLKWPEDEVQARIDQLLVLVNLEPSLRGRPPHTLSGGQAQRVGVARALAARPRVMLLDEAFGAVDPVTRDALQREYRKLHQSLGVTTVMVTHDVTEAMLMADRLAVLSAGRLVGLGTASELLAAPGHPVVERLLEMPRRQADVLRRQLARDGATP